MFEQDSLGKFLQISVASCVVMCYNKCMTTNPFVTLDKLKPIINLNEAYDKELKAINERRKMINGWKMELKKIQKERSKKKYNGRD